MSEPTDDAKATIRLERLPAPWRDAARSYVVFIDGKKVSKIRPATVQEFRVNPGKHTLRLKIDWKGSDERAAELQPGEMVSFMCEPGGTALAAGIDVVRRSKAWIALYPAPDQDE